MTFKRHAMALAFFCLTPLFGCNVADDEMLNRSCGDADSVKVNDSTYCIASSAIIEKGFMCDSAMSSILIDNVTVCSPHARLPDGDVPGVFDEVNRRNGGQPAGTICYPDSQCVDACDGPDACDDDLCQAGGCGTILPGCSFSSQCDPGEICTSGQCASGPCVDSDQCGIDEYCYQSDCIPQGSIACGVDESCPSNHSCVDGFCQENPTPPDCEDDSACDSGEMCYEGYCIEAGSLACPDGEGCPEGFTCVNDSCYSPSTNPNNECAEDADCPVEEMICTNFTCFSTGYTECVVSSQCSQGEHCAFGVCVTDACVHSSQCGSGELCQMGTCVEESTISCTDDSMCPDGAICSDSACQATEEPYACTQDADCAPLGEYVCLEQQCLPRQRVQCFEDADCPGQDSVCEVGVCRDTNDCVTSSQCDAGERCTNQRCTPGDCIDSIQCAGGELCAMGACTPETDFPCSDDAQCPNGAMCNDGVCQDNGQPYSCLDDETCQALGEFSCFQGACIPGANLECRQDTDCSDPAYVCNSGICAPAPDPDECTLSSQCEPGMNCTDGACVSTSCSADSQCGFEESCVSGQCIDPGSITCAADVDCPTNHRCLDDRCARL